MAALVVWVPKRFGRERHIAQAVTYVPDKRARHFWDSSGVLLESYQPVLGMRQDAWDIYMIYRPHARWEGKQPPKPDFWMHQLDLDQAPRLDAELFAARARSILKEVTAPVKAGAEHSEGDRVITIQIGGMT